MAEFNQEQLDLLKDRLIEELGLQARDLACLKRMHINTIGDLLKINKSEMILLDTLGKLSISHIEERLYVYTVTSDAKEHIEKEPEVNIPSSPNWDSVRKKDEEEEKDQLDASILDLEISTKAYYTLRFSNLDTIRKIVSKDEFDLKRINRKRFSDEIIEDIKKSIKEYAVQHHIETEIDGSPLFRVNQYNEKFIEEGHTTEPETADAENIEIPCEKSIAEIPEKDKVEADEKPNKKETTEIRITANKTPQNVYNPLRAQISDLNIKSKSYHALKSAEFRIVLDVLQHRKSYLENEYPKITPEILEDIDKAIRRLTSDHGCLSLALSFPFFAADAVSEKTEDDRNQLSRCIIDILKDQKLQGRKWITAHNIDAILNDEYPSIARVVTPKQIMEILELSENVRKNDLYYQYTDDAEETSETDTSERENSKSIAESILVEDERMNEESEPEADKDSGEITKEETNFLTLKRIVDTIEWVDPVETNPVSDNEESFEYAEIDQVETTTYETESLPNGYEPSITTEPEEDEPVVSEIELVEAEILDSAEEDVANSVDNSMSADASNHEERISTNLPEYRVKFFSWEKEDAGTLPVSRDESTDTQESSAGTIDAGDEKKLPDPIDEEISNEDTQQPPMHLHEVRHIMASDYSQERIEEIKDLPIEELDLSVRAYNCLKREGINTVWSLIQFSSDDILRIRNLGQLSHDEVITKTRIFMDTFDVAAYYRDKQYKKPATRDEAIDVRDIPIHMLGLSVRSYNCLKRAQIKTLGELLNKTQAELFTVRNLGETSLEEIVRIAKETLEKDDSTIDPTGFALFRTLENDISEDGTSVKNEVLGEIDNDHAEASYFIETDNKYSADNTAENIDTVDVNETKPESETADEINNSEESDAPITTEIFKKKDNEEKNEASEMISIKEAIKVLPKGYQWTINCRLEGMKTQEIADKAGVTKQRISEVLRKGMYAVFHGTKSIKAIDRVAEDDDRELFENYNISLAEWTEHLHKPAYAYHYLKLRYKKGDKPLPGSGSHRSTNKPLGLTRTPDGIKGVVNRGRLEDLLDYYKILGALDRDVVLYSDEEEFTKGIKKLCRMINREIKRKKYISDIRITDHEYTMLRGYLHYAIMMLNKTGIAPDDAMFATAVTNVAIKIYKDGNLWGNFFKEVQLKQTPAAQKNIGIKFYEVLEKFDLVRGDAGEYFQNILMHCFVSDYYANSYFDFLFNFYRIDLERDLSRLDTETMRAFMDSICSEENEGRTYMLVQHISQAMAANRRGATIRIRNHMKLLDKFFWDDTFEITTTHRLYNLMQNWAKSSKDVIGEMEAYSSGRRRGAKRFSQPYIRYMGAENIFMLVIPPQSIKRIESEEIYWNVSGGINRRLDVELMDSVIGYKVLESRNYIPFDSVLDSFQLELCTAEGQSIKKFNIRKQDIRFFDDDGYPINSNTIKTGEVTAVSRVGNIVRSSALYDSEEINGLLLSYFNFEFEDILHMPDGHVVIIGRPEITNSIAGKGRIEGAVCYMDERKYDLYGRVPYLVLRMKSSRFAGTAITINGKKQRLSDIEYESFTIDDKTDDVGYYVDLNNYLDGRDDVYRIDVDIPGGSSPHWEFVYIKDFAVEFDEAPYVFEPRGTVVFPEHIKIKEIEDFCEKEPGVNGYKFTIKEVSRTLDFVTSVGEHDVDISIPVPAFFIKNQNGEWDSNIPAPVWHADLPDVIDLAVPYHKVTLYMDDVFTDGSDSGRELTYRRNIGDDHILCDISKFKSYLTGDDIARQLRMRFGEVDSNLFTIIIHSKVISLQILGNFDTNDITVNADISGKADYYIDIRKGDETIAEKIPLIDGTARYNHEIGNGIYEVEVFELVDDDSGFGGEDYYSIGVYDQEMMNPYDMTDRSFKIIQVEEKGNPLAVLPVRYNYYVLDLKKTEDSHIYNGMMLVRKSFFKGSEIASFPVSVGFDDLNKPNYVWISFIDEYGDNTDFLYDTRKQGILQEENPMLRPMVCYRRYTFLNDEEYIYHIDFVIEHYSNDYDELSEMVDFPETDSTIVFKSHRYDSKHKRYEVDGDKKQSAAFFGNDILFVGDAPISPKSRMCLRDARIQTMNELTKMTKAEFAKLSSANIKIIRDIDSALKQYGMKFKEESE